MDSHIPTEGADDALPDTSSANSASPNLEAALRQIFDKDPEGPYGVQQAMGTPEAWIHWGCQLAKYPSLTSQVRTEYQKDVSAHTRGRFRTRISRKF